MSAIKVPAEIGPRDPALELVSAIDEVHARRLAEFEKLVRALSAEVSASATLAERAAEARARTTVEAAGEYGARQLHDAGVAGSMAILAECRDLVSQVQRLHRIAALLGVAALLCGAAALSSLVVELGRWL